MFVVLGLRGLRHRIKGYQILVSVYAFAAGQSDLDGYDNLERIEPLRRASNWVIGLVGRWVSGLVRLGLKV